jgi:hypothetical protein
MKKIFFLFPIVLAIAMIYGYKQSGQNGMAENQAKQAISKDFKGINKPEVRESNSDREYFTPEKATESRPGILLILTYDKRKAGGSTSFLRNYLYGNSGQTGC